MSLATPMGQHCLADFYGVTDQIIVTPELIKDVLIKAANHAGARVLSHHFHHFGPNQGVTGVLVLAESHISIHTWPEREYVALDIFMCGKAQPQLALDHIKTSLAHQRVDVTYVNRG